MNKSILSLIGVLGVIVLFLSGCGDSSIVERNGMDVSLKTIPPIRDSIQEEQVFFVELELANNMQCPARVYGTLKDSVSDTFLGIEDTEEFDITIDEAYKDSEGRQIIPEKEKIRFPEYDGYYYTEIDEFGLESVINADVSYRCTEDAGASFQVCMPESLYEDDLSCPLIEDIYGDKLNADNLAIAVNKVTKKVTPGQGGMRRIVLDIELAKKVSDGNPYFEDEKAVKIQVLTNDGQEFDCGLGVVKWRSNTQTITCSLDTYEDSGITAKVILDYVYKIDESIKVKVKNIE